MNDTEITEYYGSAIEGLIRDILRHTVKNTRGALYLAKYMMYCRQAHKIRARYEKKGVHIPAFMIASITSECNLRCRGCYAVSNRICGSPSHGPLLPADRWGSIFREASQIGISFILIAGGEPLLRKEVLLEAAKIKRIIFPVFTNGVEINGTFLGVFDKNRNLIPVISVEGGRQMTDLRRGTGVYEKVTEAMETLRAGHIMFGSSVTVTQENMTQVSSDSFIGHLYSLGSRIIFYNEYVPVECGTEHLALSDKERAVMDRMLTDARKSFRDVVILSFPGDEKMTGGCLAAGRGFFHIDPYGNAEPCPFSPYSDSNLKETTLVESLGSPLFKKLRETGLLEEDHSGGCSLYARREEVDRLFGDGYLSRDTLR